MLSLKSSIIIKSRQPVAPNLEKTKSKTGNDEPLI